MKTGDQTLTTAFDLKSDTKINSLKAKIINECNLETADETANELFIWSLNELPMDSIATLTVDNLEISNIARDELYKVGENADITQSDSKIVVKDLVEKSMKTDVGSDQKAELNYEFKNDFLAVDLDIETMNNKPFDDKTFCHLFKNPCKPDWTFNYHNEKCYKLVNEFGELPYYTAVNKCTDIDASSELASIHDEKTNNFIKTLARGEKIWLGAERKNNIFTWADGSGTTTDFSKW